MAAAASTLRQHTGQFRAPIGLTAIMEAVGARRASNGTMHPDGRLTAGPDGWTIHTRSTGQGWRRRRFSEAHEIGHIILYEALGSDPAHRAAIDSAAGWKSVERLCDRAAAEILIPADDLIDQLGAHPMGTVAHFNRLYDRYLVSQTVLLRRMSEVDDSLAVTTWRHKEHVRGANWRIDASYCHIDGVYLPHNLSRRHLSPDLIDQALSHGSAHDDRATLDVGNRRYTGSMSAIYPGLTRQRDLPVYQGHVIPDEVAGDQVHVVHQHLRTSPIRAYANVRSVN
jgi:hypothetical protein